jgi:hypothetical protein
MQRFCRLVAALGIVTFCGAYAHAESDAAFADHQARLQEFQERFGSRMVLSGAARTIRSARVQALTAASDFKVNNDGFGGSSHQTQLRLLRQPDSTTLAVWTDDRDANLSVYGQVFEEITIDSILPTGENFRLHTDPENLNQSDPAVIMRPGGGFYAAYTVERSTNNSDLIVQRFSQLGQPLGSPRNIADDSLNFSQRKPALALFSNGDLLVTYERDSVVIIGLDTTNVNSSISGRILRKDDLQFRGRRFTVSADLRIGSVTVVYDEREPTAAIGADDTAWVVWTDDRDGGVRDVFGIRMRQTFAIDTINADSLILHPTDTILVPVGGFFKLNDEPIAANTFQESPVLALAPDGRAIAAWADFRNGNWDIYKQSFAASSAKLGANAKVNFSDAGSLDQTDPYLGWADTIGVVAWQDFRDGSARVYYQRYHADGSAMGVNIPGGVVSSANQSFAAVGILGDGSMSLGWVEAVSGALTAYYRPFSPADAAGKVSAVANIVISAKQTFAGCGMGVNGDIFAVWEESRAALPNIVGQALTSALVKQGEVRLNGGRTTFHYTPAATVGTDEGAAVWEDYRDTTSEYSDVWLQRFTLNTSGYAVTGANVRVIDTIESQEVRLASWYPDVAMDANGNAMVVWQDNRFGSWDIFAATYTDSTSGGNPVRIGRNTRVDKAAVSTRQTYPRIDMNPTGQAVVIWEDVRAKNASLEDSLAIWGRVYSRAGRNAAGTGPDTVGTDVKLVASDARQPDVAIASDGTFGVVWENWAGADVDIYFQFFDAAGAATGSPILVNDDGLAGVNQYLPQVAATSQGYVVVWQDERNDDWDIYASLIGTGSTSAGTNYAVHEASTVNQTAPVIAGRRSASEPFIAWEDLRDASTAPDIFGNRNAPALATSTDDDDRDGLRPGVFSLNQNYPNPFNPNTDIRYVVEKPADIELIVYNAIGQKVRTLVSGLETAGEKTVRWDARNDAGNSVASGTYFYRLTWADGSVSRKMTLLK